MKKYRNSALVTIAAALFLFSHSALAETLVLSDDFSGILGANWLAGTNALYNPGGPTIAIDHEVLVATQEYDFIETKQSFSGDVLRVEVDLSRLEGSNQCLDFAIELTGLPDYSGIVRLSYGLQKFDSINVGIGPKIVGNSTTWDCIYEGSYGIETASAVPHQGTAVLQYDRGNISFSWTNDLGVTINTPTIATGVTLSGSTVRIWADGGAGSPRYIDNVKVYADSAGPSECECADSDGDGVPDDWDLCAGTPSGLYVDSSGCDVNNDSQAGLEDVISIMRTLTGM